MSSDRLFRVRAEQPFATNSSEFKKTSAQCDAPIVCSTVNVGDICAFKAGDTWKLGRVRQFSYFHRKKDKDKQYLANSVSLLDSKEQEKVGVLCSWYTSIDQSVCLPSVNSSTSLGSQSVCLPAASSAHPTSSGSHLPSPSSPPSSSLIPTSSASSPRLLTLGECDDVHVYHPLTDNLCTLSHGCFESNSIDEVVTSTCASIIGTKATSDMKLATARQVIINSRSLQFICNQLKSKVPNPSHSESIVLTDDVDDNKVSVEEKANVWLQIGGYLLQKKDYHDITHGRDLNDKVISAFLYLLKLRFPEFAGLRDTVCQLRKTTSCKIPYNSGEVILQVINLHNSHWSAIEVIGTNVYLYDSFYTSVSPEAVDLICRLLHSDENQITIHIMNTAKQVGVVDCGVYALAMITSRALGDDPVSVIYDQQQLRSHLIDLLKAQKVAAFPIAKKRRVASRFKKVEKVPLYCVCRSIFDDRPMVCCDKCDCWYHTTCVSVDSESICDKKWFCEKCL